MPNDDQAAALAKALAPLIAQHLASDPSLLRDVIRPAVEEQIDPLRKKNVELLGEVKAKKSLDRQLGESLDDWFKRLEADSAEQVAKSQADLERMTGKKPAEDNRPDPTRQLATGELYISRADARNPQAYQAAKARAEAAGKKLVIGSPEEYADSTTRNIGRPSTPAPSTKKVLTHTIDDPVTGQRFVRADVHKLASPVLQHDAARKQGLSIRTFTSLDELPEHIRHEVRVAE